MKLIYSLLIIMALSLVLSLYLPWWIIAPISLVVCYFAPLSPQKSFSIAFLAVYMAWLGSIYFFDGGAIRTIVGDLFSMPARYTPFLSAAIGGLVAGIFGAAGSLLKFSQKKSE